jgi:hypothetical protein
MIVFPTDDNLTIGLISGLAASLVIGLFRLFVKLLHIVRVAKHDANMRRISIKNVGLAIIPIPFVEISAQISYMHNNIPNKYTILVENQSTYVTPSDLDGFNLKKYFNYIFSSCTEKEELIKKGRKLSLNFDQVIVENNATHFTCFNDFLIEAHGFSNVHIVVFLSYYGKLTNVRKSKSFKLYP